MSLRRDNGKLDWIARVRLMSLAVVVLHGGFLIFIEGRGFI